MSSIGPQLPPHLQASSSRPQPAQPTQPSDSDSEDDYAPALPPSLVAQRGIGPSLPPSTSSAGPSRAAGSAVGPAPPPTYNHDEYSDSDEEVGPSLGEATRADEARSGVKEFMEREARWAKEREEAAKPKQLKREEWMLVPPEAGDFATSVDPLKARGFSRTGVDPSKTKDQTLWTETPAERQQRLQDEISGKKRKAELASSSTILDEAELNAMKRRKMRDGEIERSIREHNASHRAAPLLETRKKSTKEKEREKKDKEAAPPPIWDRDLHMGVTGRLMDEKDRAKTIRDARGLGDRFGHGKGGAYS